MKSRVVFIVVSMAVVLVLVGFSTGAGEVVSDGVVRLMGIFGQVVSLVRSNYVEEVPLDRLEVGALTGLVESADPGGDFVPDDGTASYAAVRARALPAFGLVLGKRASYPFVLQVLPGSAAEKAGILPGELIERAGTEPVRARPLWRALVILDEAERKGQTVALDIIDRQFDGERRVVLTPIVTPEPAARIENCNGVPVVRLESVNAKLVKQIDAELKPFGDVPAVVVDLRGLALGSIESAPDMAAMLSGGATEVTIERRDGKPRVLRANGPKRSWKVVACVDPTTAGPAEAVLLALKAQGATIVGGESYGDTGERKAVRAGGGEVWLADEWCNGPDGKPLLGTGLKPDELVRSRKGVDAILDRALEIARGDALPKAA